MDSRWASRCDETQSTNRLHASFNQQSAAVASSYYSYSQDLPVSSISPQALEWPLGSGQATTQRVVPPRGKSNRVRKSAAVRHSNRQSPLSSSTQEQLAQLVASSNSHSDDVADLTSIRDLDHDPSTEASISSAFDNGGVEFHLHDEDHPTHIMSSPMSLDTTKNAMVKSNNSDMSESAADIVMKSYPAVKIDSLLCKKLAGEIARREPAQRRRDQKLNIERRSNVEALLAHVAGEVAPRPCKNCHKGHGPWTVCVVYDGQMCGSCTNCWFNASGSRCTFHESNNPPPPLLLPPGHISHPMLNFPQIPVLASSSSPGPIASFQAELAHWGAGDRSRLAASSVLADTMTMSKSDRYIAKIEAAATELGICMAEFYEYQQSPEGMAEFEREQRAQMSQQNHAEDISVNQSSPEEPLS